MASTQLNQNQTKGLGAWTSFVPAWTSLTKGSGANTGYYQQIGKTVSFRVNFTLAADSSVGTTPILTLPVSISTTNLNGLSPIGQVSLSDAGAVYMGFIDAYGAIRSHLADATYGKSGGVSSTTPFTWTTGDAIYITGTYEAA